MERYSRAQAAFNAYVACKWPIHIFALDPVVDQQNELDLFSQRTQLQLALAIAVSSGQVNFQNAESYARRTELDLAIVALNRTAIGFGAGETTFGWQFYPRVQTPPLQSNASRIAGILINNGPGPDYDLANRKIEPGQRECYALVVMPNFVPSVKFTSVTNWFDLKTKHAEQVLETTDMIRLGKKLQAAKNGLQRVCDSGKYRPEEVELLADRISQLEDLLPVKSHSIDLPFEGSLLGSEIFSSNAAGLAPRLLAWYGEPAQEGSVTSIFILGNGFSVHELHVIAGGVTVPDASVEVISRNVLRVDIPANARAVQTKLKIDGVYRRLLDVHVASPNGISNHLLVEAQPSQALASSATSATYSLSPDTRTLTVTYTLLGARDRKNGVPIYLGFQPGTAELDLNWTDSLGIAPKTVDVTFNFPNPRVAAEGPLMSTLTGVAGANGQYAIDNSAGLLDQLSRDLLSQADQHNLLAADNPVTQLTSSSIDVAPVKSTNLDTNEVSITDPLVVNLTPTSVVARLSPVSITVDPANFKLADNTASLTISWPPSVRVLADVKISLRDKNTGRAVGSLEFARNEVVYQAGTGTISAKTLQDKLTAAQKSFESQAGVAAGAFPAGDALVADSIILSPQFNGLVMDPVLVTSNFEIDFAKAKPANSGGAAGAAGTPAGPRAPVAVPPLPGASGPASGLGSRSPAEGGPNPNASAAAFRVLPALPRRFGAGHSSNDLALDSTESTMRAAATAGTNVRASRSSATPPPLSAPAQPEAVPASSASGTAKEKTERPGRFRLFSRLSQEDR